jgi:hypothetical protein
LAVGRRPELIACVDWRTPDLSEVGFQRIMEKRPFVGRAMI